MGETRLDSPSDQQGQSLHLHKYGVSSGLHSWDVMQISDRYWEERPDIATRAIYFGHLEYYAHASSTYTSYLYRLPG